MEIGTKKHVSVEILLKAFNHMMLAKAMADIYEENRNLNSRTMFSTRIRIF